jgi:hypothetical protein
MTTNTIFQLNAQKKEVVDTDALIERYKKEIEDLKQRLAEREKEAETPARTRRLSTKEVSKHMNAPARLISNGKTESR